YTTLFRSVITDFSFGWTSKPAGTVETARMMRERRSRASPSGWRRGAGGTVRESTKEAFGVPRASSYAHSSSAFAAAHSPSTSAAVRCPCLTSASPYRCATDVWLLIFWYMRGCVEPGPAPPVWPVGRKPTRAVHTGPRKGLGEGI